MSELSAPFQKYPNQNFEIVDWIVTNYQIYYPTSTVDLEASTCYSAVMAKTINARPADEKPVTHRMQKSGRSLSNIIDRNSVSLWSNRADRV